MAGNVPDDAFARALQQMGAVTFDQLESARAAQAQSAKKGVSLALADVLVQQGHIPAVLRENVEKKLQAQQAGGMPQLGPYKLLKKLGEGGMGAVYLAEDTMVRRQVAVKVLPKKYSEEREFLTRFRREAQATGKLNHVNIVMAYNVGEEAGTHYYAMEYCEGETLDRILKHDKVIPWDAAVGVVLQVSRGLKHAHDHGIIHRDIKPANVFICAPLRSPGVPPGPDGTGETRNMGTGETRNAGTGETRNMGTGETPLLRGGFVAKILDLGLSKTLGGTEQSFYTQTGVALGTPHYISPEQAKGDKGIDGRTDIYSLGATFYHLVTGQTPFTGSTAAIIMMKHLTEQLPNPQDLNADIPDGVVQVIQKMMAKDPADRYGNCDGLIADLEEVAQGKLPSSQALDVGKSSVAVARAVRSRDRKGAVLPLAHARGSEAQRGTRQHEPVGDRRRGGRRAEDAAELEPLEAARKRTRLYAACGVLGVGLMIFVGALIFSGKPETRSSRPEGSERGGGQSSVVSGEKTSSGVVQPDTRSPTPETRPVDDPARWAKAINLLALVDPKQDAKAGKWEMKDGALVVEPGDDSKLRLPYRPAEEYDFRIVFTRETGEECVMQCLRAGGHSFRWRMGGWGNTILGFGVIGKDDANANASRVQVPQCLRNGTRHTSVVRVRKGGVKGWLDGKLITKWNTDYQDMGLLPNWTLGDDTVLGLACQFSRTVFHSIEVLEVTGKGAFTRGGAATGEDVNDPARWVKAIDLLPLVDTKRDTVSGEWRVRNGSLTTQSGGTVAIRIPYRPPEEYDCRVELSSERANPTVGMILPTRGGNVNWALFSGRAGFELVDGRDLMTNPTVKDTGGWPKPTEHGTVTIQVRRAGLKTWLDGRLFYEFPTDYMNLRAHQQWYFPEKGLLALGVLGTVVFHRCEVLEVTGQGTFTRPDDPAAKEAERKRGGVGGK